MSIRPVARCRKDLWDRGCRAALKIATARIVCAWTETKVERRCSHNGLETGTGTGAETAQKLENPLRLRQLYKYEMLEGSDEAV